MVIGKGPYRDAVNPVHHAQCPHQARFKLALRGELLPRGQQLSGGGQENVHGDDNEGGKNRVRLHQRGVLRVQGGCLIVTEKVLVLCLGQTVTLIWSWERPVPFPWPGRTAACRTYRFVNRS